MLKKLRKGALTIEFIVVVSILVLIVGLGTSWVVAQYNNAEDNANSVAEVIIKDANGLVGGGENGGQGGSESTPEPSEPVNMITFTCYYLNGLSPEAVGVSISVGDSGWKNYTNPDTGETASGYVETFTCPEGMTWREFAESDYSKGNTALVFLSGDRVIFDCYGGPAPTVSRNPDAVITGGIYGA